MTDLFPVSPRAADLRERVRDFMTSRVLPAETTLRDELAAAGDRFSTPPTLERLKGLARSEGLWNLFLPAEAGYGSTPAEAVPGTPLTNLEYAPICEEMGRVPWAPEVFNCNAPDTGNMEVLLRYGTEAQRERWLTPLLAGEIRSCFAMTEPDVASSDATNIRSAIVRDGNEYVLDGRKWWVTQAPRAECRVAVFMGKTDPGAERHRQQSMILVPMDTPGVEVLRPLTVFGYDSAPRGHGEIAFTGARVPVENLLLGEGRGFEIAQGRLGPGRVHHCMRAIGLAERALEAMVERAKTRVAFGGPLAEKGALRHAIAKCRIAIEQTRLLTLDAACRMDAMGNKAARAQIAMIKIAAPRMACRVLDRAIQVHGGAGVSGDVWLAEAYAHARTLRLADGPDEVHLESLARLELSGPARG